MYSNDPCSGPSTCRQLRLATHLLVGMRGSEYHSRMSRMMQKSRPSRGVPFILLTQGRIPNPERKTGFAMRRGNKNA